MNFQQMRCLCEISTNGLSISRAAETLHTSQSGVSKQVSLLESELGVLIFHRSRGRLSGITPTGEHIIGMAKNIVRESNNMKALCNEVDGKEGDPLVVAVTHTQARYVLPEVIKRYSRSHATRVTMKPATPEQIVSMLLSGQAEIGITADDAALPDGLQAITCRRFEKVVVVPKGHPLLQESKVSLESIARFPLITYEPGFSARRQVVETFERNGLQPDIKVSAIDADVIKACVESRLGIAVLSEVAFDSRREPTLRALPAGHLFPPSMTRIILCQNRFPRKCVRDFIKISTADH